MTTWPLRLLTAAALLAAVACSDGPEPAPPATSPTCSAAPRATFSAPPRATGSPRATASPRAAASPRAQTSPLPSSSASGVTRQVLMGEVVSFKNGDLVVNDQRSGQRLTVAVDSKTQVRSLLTSPAPTARATPGAIPSTPITPSPRTREPGPAASPVPASSLKAGQTVTVTAAHRADGTLLATAVVIRPPVCVP